MQIVDSHAHLADPKFTSDLDRVIARAHESRVESIICIGDSVASSQRSVAIAHRHSKVFATAGLHPHSAKDWSDKVEAALQELASDRRVVGIGETGLDYHHNHSDRAVQMTAFRQQVRLAKALRLPVVIHCREAAEDVVRVLEQEQSERLRGVIHCFAETLEIARRALDLGFHLGIGGLITFKTSETLRGVVAAIGLDRLVVETDSPYLAPVPKRGRRNEPSYLRHTVTALAEATGHNALDAARITRHNAIELFRLPLRQPSALAYAVGDRLYLNITNRCTNRCEWCQRGEDWFAEGHNLEIGAEPSAEEILKSAESYALSRFEEVVIAGLGEPTLRLDVVLDVAKRLRERKCRVRMITNGQGDLVNEGGILPRLGAVLDAITVTLNAPCAEAYTRLSHPANGEESFEAVIRFLEAAPSHVEEVTISAVDDERVDASAVRQQVADRLGLKMTVDSSHPIA